MIVNEGISKPACGHGSSVQAVYALVVCNFSEEGQVQLCLVHNTTTVTWLTCTIGYNGYSHDTSNKVIADVECTVYSVDTRNSYKRQHVKQ